uniref:Uncharacterized protein n=1 Tax=Rhizophagus irregularis (strain DAOM 181602 / DAOM 197198 / MUCL 43194) TaxID=747089 RepID=U9TNI6_RHIID
MLLYKIATVDSVFAVTFGTPNERENEQIHHQNFVYRKKDYIHLFELFLDMKTFMHPYYHLELLFEDRSN